MSVIIALISNRDGIVASDGRRFASVNLILGQALEPARIESDDFDKTFSINGGKIIGAFAGLLEFSGKLIATHVSEIAAVQALPDTFQALTTIISAELTNRLGKIKPTEVIFDARKLDLLLVSGQRFNRSNLQIASVRFYPKDGKITSEIDIVSALPGRKQFYLYGDDNAQDAAKRLLAKDNSLSRDIGFLMGLAHDAIKEGIRGATQHPHGNTDACGGRIFNKRTWYQA